MALSQIAISVRIATLMLNPTLMRIYKLLYAKICSQAIWILGYDLTQSEVPVLKGVDDNDMLLAEVFMHTST